MGTFMLPILQENTQTCVLKQQESKLIDGKRMASNFQGFYRLSPKQRIVRLQELGYLDNEGVALLQQNDTEYLELANYCIENAISTLALPLGIATHFQIDGRDYAIPMAVEESSVIAAASATAKWVRQHGTLTTEALGTEIIGQIQIAKAKNLPRFKQLISSNKSKLINQVNTNVLPNLVARGGGVTDIQCRTIKRPDFMTMIVLHVHLNPCDAMGANFVTQACEYLKPHIENLTQESISICIVSNLCDTHLIRAQVCINDLDLSLAHTLAEAALFAELDPYRAATHNKGIMNGIDAVLLATGNDWRAVEAGMHAYAARNGQYTALTQWRLQAKQLVGTLTAPINVGTVGGVTHIHPMTQCALKILKINSARELACVCAAVGLIQNLGALRALVGPGLVAGHMKLHINNLIFAVKAAAGEELQLRMLLEKHLQQYQKVSESDARNYLSQIRSDQARATAS